MNIKAKFPFNKNRVLNLTHSGFLCKINLKYSDSEETLGLVRDQNFSYLNEIFYFQYTTKVNIGSRLSMLRA